MKKSTAIASLLLVAGLLSPVSPATAAEAVECTIVGTTKADKIVGTSKADVICAGAGNDVIYGMGGNDEIRAGSGNDKIFGGAGNDTIAGEAGSDSVDGGSGSDAISGGSGRDFIDGVSGNDMLKGGDSADSILGGTGNDMIDGGSGSDTIRTGAGSDICTADATDSRLDSCVLDNAAPEFGPMTMDVKQFQAGETAVFTFNVMDASGVQGIWGFIGGAPGWVTDWCGFGFEAVLTDGTNKSGTYEIRCDIPADAVNDNYSLFLNTSDVLGNAGHGPTIAFEVTGGSSDNRTPIISNIDLPATAKAGETITVSVSATDDSGIAGIYGWFMLDGGGFSDGRIIYAMATGESKLTSGTFTDGILSQDIAFDPAAPEGTYTLWMSVKDVVGNREFYSTDKQITITK